MCDVVYISSCAQYRTECQYVLYISSFLHFTGTGKTATVLATINALRKDVTAGKLPDFSFIEINCLRLKSPADACKYSLLPVSIYFPLRQVNCINAHILLHCSYFRYTTVAWFVWRSFASKKCPQASPRSLQLPGATCIRAIGVRHGQRRPRSAYGDDLSGGRAGLSANKRLQCDV